MPLCHHYSQCSVRFKVGHITHKKLEKSFLTSFLICLNTNLGLGKTYFYFNIIAIPLHRPFYHLSLNNKTLLNFLNPNFKRKCTFIYYANFEHFTGKTTKITSVSTTLNEVQPKMKLWHFRHEKHTVDTYILSHEDMKVKTLKVIWSLRTMSYVTSRQEIQAFCTCV